MATPYVDDLALVSKNNEGIDEVFAMTAVDDTGTEVPIDLTGYTFFAQARVAKSKTADLICEIFVEVFGDPTLGQLKFSVSDEVLRDVEPVRGHYDVLVRSGEGIVDNLYQAPFQVGGGVTDVAQWL